MTDINNLFEYMRDLKIDTSKYEEYRQMLIEDVERKEERPFHVTIQKVLNALVLNIPDEDNSKKVRFFIVNKKYTEEDKKREAFLRIANALHSHWRVSNPEEKKSLQCGGHTRLFDVLIPDDYVTVGESVNGKGHREHIVPCALIRSESYRMFNDGYLVDHVSLMIEQNLKIVHITKEERHRLDVELALKITMPEGWSFEQNRPFARLDTAEIEYKLY